MDFKELYSLSSPAKNLTPSFIPSVASDINNVNLSPVFALPLSLPLVKNCNQTISLNTASACQVSLPDIINGIYAGKVDFINPKSNIEYPAVTVLSSDNMGAIQADIGNIEEWLKHKSDGIPCLELDTEVRSSEVDINDLLFLKPMPSNNNVVIDPSIKLVHNTGLPLARRYLVQDKGNNSYMLSDNTSFLSGNDISKAKCLKKFEILKCAARNKGLGLGLFEEMLLSDRTDKRNMKCKDSTMYDKGILEELLLPVQEFLLTVMDKKDGASSSQVESIVVPSHVNDASNIVNFNDYIAICGNKKVAIDEYDIERNTSHLNLMMPQEIEPLEFQETRSKSDSLAENDLMPGSTVSTDNKLFNVLEMDIGIVGDAMENNEDLAKGVVLSDPYTERVDTPTSETEDSPLKLNIKYITSPTVVNTEVITSYSDIKPIACISHNSSQKCNLVQITSVPLPIKIVTKPPIIDKANNINANEVQNISDDIGNGSISPSSLPLKTLKVKTSVKSAKPKNLTEPSSKKASKLSRFSIGGIAKVEISINCNTNATIISILSSNKEQTTFKVHSTDALSAINSIKEECIHHLGLTRQQLLQTAKAADKILAAHSDIKGKRSTSKSHNKIFEISQLIEEMKPPESRHKVADLLNVIKRRKHLKDKSPVAKKVTEKELRACKQKTDEICKSVVKNSDKSKTQGENVMISLLPGAPPTMVSVPSVLDALSRPTTSKIKIDNVLVKKESSGKKKNAENSEEIGQDEKTNVALLQIGFDPDSLVPVISSEGKKWVCPLASCSKTYPKLAYLKIHILTHEGVRPYKCSYENCDWSFYTSYKLKRHLETHLKRRDFICKEPNCNRRFTTIYNLKTHMGLHSRPKTWICTVISCDASFHSRRRLESHIKTNHADADPPYKCSVDGCSKAYFTPNSLASHTRGHHKDDDIWCQWGGCQKKFDKPCRLKAHMMTHTGQRPYQCTYEGCNWKFHSASKLSRHQRKHTNERKFSCPICKKAFLRSEHLKGHLLTHTGVRNFQCPIQNCYSTFTAKSSLYVHLKKHKLATRKLNCPLESCSAAYDTKISLRQHLLKDHTSFQASDSTQLDYIMLIGDKDVSEVIPCASESESILSGFSPFTLGVREMPNNDSSDSAGEANIIRLLPMSSGLLESTSEASLPLLVADGFPSPEADSANSSDFGLMELFKSTTKTVNSLTGSSARTDTLGNLILSQRAKKRQTGNLTKNGVASHESCKVNFCNDFILSSSVGDSLPGAFQPIIMHEDGLSVSLYQDLLTETTNPEPTCESQSTINLRDLE